MKTKLGLVLAVLAMSGCASMESKWEKVEVGQSKDKVLDEMGQPNEIRINKNGDYVYGWNFNAYSGCGVVFDNTMSVKEKGCATDPEAQARYQQAQMMFYQNMQNNMQQQQMYQQQNLMNFQNQMMQNRPRTPQRTNCTTSGYGNTAYTNCNTY